MTLSVLKKMPFLAAILASFLLSGCGRIGEAPVDDRDRIVSLTPSITEIVCAIGAQDLLVGRSSACNYPTSMVSKVPVIGGFGDPSIERVLAVKPTLILENELADETLGQKLDKFGLRRERVKCDRLIDIPPAILEVGRLLHKETEAGRLADRFAHELAALRKDSEAATNRPSVFVEIWGDPLTTAGKNSFLSDLVNLAGGRNVGDEVETAYYQISPEWVVSRNPDIIFCFYMAKEATARSQVMSRSGWSDIGAIRRGRVYDRFDNDILLRPGPRTLIGVQALRRCIQEEPERP